MSVLDIQRRGQQVGRLRIGEQVAVIKDGKDTGKTRPARRDTFRLTTGSRHLAEAAAAYFGSEAKPWNGQWDVDTRVSELPVMVPPRDAVISQHYEMWNAGGAVRRCDSQREQIGGGPCLCPHAGDSDDAEEVARAALRRADMAKKNPPQACHLITRINFMIPDLPGLGVFRLDTSSYYAAVEIGDAATLMQAARDQGVFLSAILRIDQRSRVANGQTKKYPVPVLEITSTFRQIASGELAAGGMAAQLPPAPGTRPRAITGGTVSPLPPAVPAARRDAASEEVVDAEIVNEWLDAALASAVTLPDEESGRNLWRESAAKAHAGEITGADAARVQGLITARLADLRSDMAPLDPEDPWSLKVEGLDTDADAGDALGELDVLRAKGAVEPGHAARIRAAVLLRFPQAAAS